jgi:AGZA family xanthine/uracil permease-like MFS transporter
MRDYFSLATNNTNYKTEIIAGFTTFLASMYIIVVNPSLISQAGLPFSGVLTATVLVSALSSIMMGIFAKNPIVIAPGMGLNVFFAFSVVMGMGVTWQRALGAVFWSGIIFILLSVFNIRTYILRAIPKQIRFAVAAGIGLLITYVGFMNARFIVSNKATLITFGGLNAVTVTFVIGLLITSLLVVKRVKAALIMGVVLTTLLAIPIGRLYGDSTVLYGAKTVVSWQGLFAAPDFSLLFKLDLLGSLSLSLVPVIFAFVFTDMFDSLSTFVGVAEAADLKDEDGEPRNVKQSLIVDAISTTISGLFGTSAGTSYIESAAGIKEGGRTGLTAIVAGLFFLPFLFISPLLSIVPSLATAPALVLVGVFMMTPIAKINWQNFDDAIPAFLSIMLIPLTNSITQGLIWGFLSWTVIKVAFGKIEDISLMLVIIDIFAILALIVR